MIESTSLPTFGFVIFVKKGMNKLDTNVAFITGGTKGIGLGIVKALLSKGVKVAFSGRDEKSIRLLEKQLSEAYPNSILGIQCDVRKLEDLQKCIQIVLDKFQKIDVVVANAGVGSFASVDTLSVDAWHQMIDTNLTGAFYTLKASIEQLKLNKGYFITISSLAGTNFFKGASAYNASKFGVTGFTQAAMLDLREFGIKTTTIMPGSVATNFNNHLPSAKDAWKIQPEDLGQIVVDLLEMNERTLPSKIEVRPSFPN